MSKKIDLGVKDISESGAMGSKADQIKKVSELIGEIRLLGVRYDGSCFAADPIDASDVKYKTLWRVRVNDIVLSNINAVNGAIGVVPEQFAGCYISSEYTVLRVKDGIDPHVFQLLLRSPECRADLLLNASGIGRHRVTLAGVAKTKIPYPDEKLSKELLKDLKEARELEQRARVLFEKTAVRVGKELAVDTPSAHELLRAFKPPK